MKTPRSVACGEGVEKTFFPAVFDNEVIGCTTLSSEQVLIGSEELAS
jgi:hypothetical protein